MSANTSAERGEPNLTPILDMVFQLITFFMLVINFKAASLDLSLKLPVLGSARPVDGRAQTDLLVLNVDAQGRLIIYGKTQEIEPYIAFEAANTRALLKAQKPGSEKTDELPTTVVVRADRETPFHLLNRVLTVCQEKGYRKFSLKALTREGGT